MDDLSYKQRCANTALVPQKQVRYHDGLDDTLFHCISPMSLQDRTIFTDKQHLATYRDLNSELYPKCIGACNSLLVENYSKTVTDSCAKNVCMQEAWTSDCAFSAGFVVTKDVFMVERSFVIQFSGESSKFARFPFDLCRGTRSHSLQFLDLGFTSRIWNECSWEPYGISWRWCTFRC